MKIVFNIKSTLTIFLIFLFILQSKVLACSLDSNKKFAVLSGPVSSLLTSLKLNNKDNIQYALTYHKHFFDDTFKNISFLKGGIFLSKSNLNKNDDLIYILDDSMEYKKLFKNHKKENYKFIKTIKMDPFEAYKYTLDSMKVWLVNCEKNIINLNKKILKVKKYFENTKPIKSSVFFFIGRIHLKSRLPTLLNSNDGAVKFLKEKELITTYPSTLPYVMWSEKIMKKLINSNKTYYIGVYSGDDKIYYEFDKKRKLVYVNFSSRDFLIPGISQIFSLMKIYQKLYKLEKL